jgi:hypothetical protein
VNTCIDTRYVLVALVGLGALTFFASVDVFAASYLTRVSDRLSTSAPATSTNQTIQFTLAQAVPANGAIELYFNEGGFTIPAGMTFGDVDLSVAASEAGPFVDRVLHSVQTAGTDDVTITSGSSGMIRIDLNTSFGIGAGQVVRVEIGTNATSGAQGTVQMTLAALTGTYPVTLRTYDVADAELDYGRTMIAIVEQVQAGPVDTTDQDPPIITFAEPSGLLQVGTRAVQMWVITNELSACKWATSSMAYDVMPYIFTSTSTFGLANWHFSTYAGLEDDTDYDVFIRCIDFRLNEIDPDYLLEFTVGITPGSASSTATSTGTGTGTGSSTATSTATSTGSGTGTGTGSGSGPSGSGGGSSSTGGDGDGNSDTGGGTGFSQDDGDKLPQATVLIEGWAYPGAAVSIMQDGKVVKTEAAAGDATFSHRIEGLDRGSYSFGLYAVDSGNTRSATYATTLWLRSDTLNALSNVMLPPTVSVVENSVQPGTPLAVTGYSAPNAHVTTWLRPRLAEVSIGDVVSTTTAAANGAWAVTLETSELPLGTYELVAQGAMPDGLIESDKSARKTVGVGVEVADDDCKSIGDLNCDGSVNLVDFSILVFNWNTANEVADINSDGTVSLPDFSVMLFYWTG